jgi:hypothetical protein
MAPRQRSVANLESEIAALRRSMKQKSELPSSDVDVA